MKRLLLLDDDELELILAWFAHVRDDVLHDVEDDDEEVAEKLRAARLAP